MKMNIIKKIIILLTITFLSIVNAAGVGAGQRIIAPSVNIELIYTSGSGSAVTENGSYHEISDITSTVLTINGLVEIGVDETALSSLTPVGNIYTNVIAGTDYTLSYAYLNRGNAEDNVSFSATITEVTSGNWTGATSSIQSIAEDSFVTFSFTIRALTANVENLETATFNVLTSIVTPDNVVSYNSFADAVMAYSGPAGYSGYGGTDNIEHQIVIQIEDYNLSYLSRLVTINAPPDYPNTDSDLVPGSKIRYSIVVKNDTSAIAKDIVLTDIIPNNCHLYYTDTPSIEGGTDSSWEGETNNDASQSSPGNGVQFQVTIATQETVTLSYSVTVD
jgi:uncharacterized repeat protein (TIGR01451 family)